MRRIAITAALLAVTAALAPAGASAAVGNARLLSCDSALDPAARARGVRGPHARGARHDADADALHAPDPPQGQSNWHALSAPGFGRWLSANPGIGRYVYTKRVVSVFAPASYRTVVRFRWLGRGGRRIASRSLDLTRLPAARPAPQPAPARDRRARRRRRRARSLRRAGREPREDRRRPLRRRGHRERGDADARADARPRPRRARARRGRRPALHGGLDADRRRRPHRRRRRARGRRTTASACRAPPRRPREGKLASNSP